ncbi:hypothetical protein EXIGLDRAFT_764199 [Exidia glandulosa HHB12029]|uniref:Uncharacterized protein n=1 Tax=Exidia glandulosa HHB12029 TaxID=1314781 RepID=A0A165LCU4_EXIGL|nr:hypothetical protein EXIGLDRAFT_764199 [Exidia glandulosa HHB12029]
MPTFDDDPFFPQPQHHYNPTRSVNSSTTAFSDEPPSYDKTIESDKLNQEHLSQQCDCGDALSSLVRSLPPM